MSGLCLASWLVWFSQSKKVCSSWFLSWNTCDVHAVHFFWPSVLITCPKFDNLLPELELSISVPFVLMLQLFTERGLLQTGWLLHIVDRCMTNILFPWASVEFWILRLNLSDSVLGILQRRFWKSRPLSLNYKHYSPALTHESDLVNRYYKTLHTNPHISQCLQHVVN